MENKKRNNTQINTQITDICSFNTRMIIILLHYFTIASSGFSFETNLLRS